MNGLLAACSRLGVAFVLLSIGRPAEAAPADTAPGGDTMNHPAFGAGLGAPAANHLIESTPAALLAYLGERLAVPDNPGERLLRAPTLAHIEVQRVGYEPHDAPPEVVAASPEVRALLMQGPRGPQLNVALAEARVLEWLAPTGGPDTIVLMWAQAPGFGVGGGFFAGQQGLALLDATPATVVGRALAAARPGAYQPAAGGPVGLLADPRGEWLAAARLLQAGRAEPAAERLAAVARAAAVASDERFLLCLAQLRAEGAAAAPLALQAAAAQTPARALFLRALAWALGRRAEAGAGLDVGVLPAGTLAALGLTVAPDPQGRPAYYIGPPPTAALPTAGF